MTKPVLVVYLIAILLILNGCSPTQSENSKYLPVKAVVVRDLGNGWIVFKLFDSQFLFYKGADIYEGYMAITQIK